MKIKTIDPVFGVVRYRDYGVAFGLLIERAGASLTERAAEQSKIEEAIESAMNEMFAQAPAPSSVEKHLERIELDGRDGDEPYFHKIKNRIFRSVMQSCPRMQNVESFGCSIRVTRSPEIMAELEQHKHQACLGVQRPH